MIRKVGKHRIREGQYIGKVYLPKKFIGKEVKICMKRNQKK